MDVLHAGTGAGRGGAVTRALGWSITVVFLGSLLAVAIMPSAQGRAADDDKPAVPRATEGAAADRPVAADAASTTAATAAPTSAAPATSAPASTRVPGSTTPAGTAAKKAGAPTTRTPAAAPAAPAVTAPATRLQPDGGSYALTMNGSSWVDGKASSVPATGSLVVQQRSTTEQSQQTTGLPGNIVLVQRATASGLDLVSLSLTAASKTLTFQPPSPLPFVRTDAPVGTSWSWSARSTDGSVNVSQTATVTGIGPVLVGGLSVPAVTVDRVMTATGTVQGTLRLTSTVSLLDRLPLVQRQALDVKATFLGLFSTRIVSDVTATLTSTRPR